MIRLATIFVLLLNPLLLLAADVLGKVSKVGAQTISMQLDADAAVKPGDPVEVYFIAPGTNKESVVATGSVSLVLDGKITVQVDNGIEKISENFGVRISTAAADSAPPAPETEADIAQRELPSYIFRGLEAGRTNKTELQQDSKWGNPVSQSRQADGAEHLRYRIRGYQSITVVLRNGVVQTIDVTLPQGVSPGVAAEGFELGEPAGSDLSAAARIGTTIADSWKPVRYSAGRVLLFSEDRNGSAVARLLRIYAPSVLTTANAKPFVPKVEYTLHGQDDTSRRIVQSVIKLVEDIHFSSRKVDDEIAPIWLDNFINSLDPGRLYLLQSDVDSFRKTASEIDDKARLGDVGFAYRIFETYVARFTQGQTLAREYLAADHDFTLDEELQIGGSAFPENPLELREIWRKRIKYEILSRRAKGADPDEARARVARHLDDLVRTPGHVDDGRIMDWCITSLVNALDPHSDFYSPREMEDFRINQELQMVGIGARLKIEDGYLTVAEIIDGSPSGKDGRLGPDDRIVGVAEGTRGEVRSVVGMQLSDSVRLIRGKAGTVVRLKILPKHETDTRYYDLKRERFVLQDHIRSTIITQTHSGGQAFKIGVIVVPTFYNTAGSRTARSSVSDTRKAVEEFRRNNVDVVLLDFRSNGGGTLTEAINYPGLFLNPGSVVQTKDRAGKVEQYQPEGVARVWSGPLVVMTNRFTGSGAEIFIGAMRDYRRALLIGDSTTNANGTAQRLYDIGQQLHQGENPPQLGSLRLTYMMFYRPNGDSVQLRGVTPHITMSSVLDAATYGEAALKNPLPFDRISAVEIPADYLTAPEMVAELRVRSEQRRAASAEYQEFAGQIQKVRERGSRTNATLNEIRFLAEYGQREDTAEDSETVIKRDAYVNEALEIAADYAAQQTWLALYASGMQKLSRGEYASARSDFEKGLAVASEQPSLLLARGKARAASGDWDGAMKDYKAAGQEAISARVTKNTQLKVQSRVLRELKPGDRVFISNTNDTWVWAEFAEDRSLKGWIRNNTVAPGGRD